MTAPASATPMPPRSPRVAKEKILASPSCKVYILSVRVTIKGYRKSFHWLTKLKVTSTIRAGRICGRIMLVYVRHRLAPSMHAASSKSMGMACMYCISR